MIARALPLVLGRATSVRERISLLDVRAVIACFVVAQWAIVLGIALIVRHNGWIYYQGGDQLWYYTGGWLLGHGHLPQPLVGYLWSFVLAPIAFVAGPNVANAYPAVVVLDVVVLLPIALLAFYGIARLIGGRLFAYWALLLWICTPLVGVRFTEPGYHQRYTELTLPQGFGLTAMADFPAMVAVLISIYFCARTLFAERPQLIDAAAAGLGAGAAIAIKPSAALFLAGPLLAFVAARFYRIGAVFVAALLPALITLALWKWRGYGYLPLLHASGAARSAAGAAPLTAFTAPSYLHFDWHQFTTQLDLLREHFWSARLIEWFVVAGLIGLGRRSPRGLALVGGWFAAFVIVKGGYSHASIEDGSLLRILIPAYPAFVLLLASLPFIVPGRRRVSGYAEEPTAVLARRHRLAAIGIATLLTAVVPFAAIASARPLTGAPLAGVLQTPLIPVDVDLHTRARASVGSVSLNWRPEHPVGGPVFFHVYRTKAETPAFNCATSTPAEQCTLTGATDLGTTRTASFVDRNPPPGRWQYRVGVAANWLDDVTQGDVYVLGRPVTVTVG